MKKRKKIKLYLAYTFGLLFTLPTVWGQNNLVYDKNKISTETELNFAFTNKRGIKAKNGIIYYVENDKKTIIAYEKGRIKWKTNIFEHCRQPAVGLPEIRYISLYNSKLKIVFGKHDFAEVNINNGKTKYLGAD